VTPPLHRHPGTAVDGDPGARIVRSQREAETLGNDRLLVANRKNKQRHQQKVGHRQRNVRRGPKAIRLGRRSRRRKKWETC
jgi:hypothetical protein